MGRCRSWSTKRCVPPPPVGDLRMRLKLEAHAAVNVNGVINRGGRSMIGMKGRNIRRISHIASNAASARR